MPTTTPQDRKPADGSHKFTVKGKSYTLPPVGEDAANTIPGGITYAAVMEPENVMAQMRLALATLEAVNPPAAVLTALKSLPTKEMLEVVGAWMGGVFGLLGLIAVHRGAVEYDLRQRFGLGLRDVGDRVTLFEVARLVTILRHDPSSAITAALEGWDYPIDRTALAVLDLYDLTVLANSDTKKGRPKPHDGRPFKFKDRSEQKYGDTKGRSRAEVVAILNGLGHSLPV